jgi:hypothetical protein
VARSWCGMLVSREFRCMQTKSGAAASVRPLTVCWASHTNGTAPSPSLATGNGRRAHTHDVVSLGNLCVDVVLQLDKVLVQACELCTTERCLSMSAV